MTNHIFVLSYCGAQDFFNTIRIKDFPGSTFYFIDNGAQTYDANFTCATYTTSTNLGCAGGWNLICSIAFEHLNLDKIIITQDDATYTETQIEEALEETSSTCLTGVYQPYFEFSCFAIHKDTWKKVGAFDENFIYVYSEDADYKQRCMLQGITLNSLLVPSVSSNKSLTIKKNPAMNRILHNREYLRWKWGESIHPSQTARNDCQPPFKYRTPFNELVPLSYIPKSNRLNTLFPGLKNSSRFPSEVEYDIFKTVGLHYGHNNTI
jgi:hypothetical protein